MISFGWFACCLRMQRFDIIEKMKTFCTLLLLTCLSNPAWGETESAIDSKAEVNSSSTLFMSLQEVQKTQAREQAEALARSPQPGAGLPPAPPPKSKRKSSWVEHVVSGVVKGAARQETFTNPDRDLRPRPEPVSPHWRGEDEK